MKNSVGSRELKTRLGTYLRRVQHGETLVVTERGRPVAELRPIAAEASGEQRKIEELIALGLVTRESEKQLTRIRPVRLEGQPAASTVVEDREDRL